MILHKVFEVPVLWHCGLSYCDVAFMPCGHQFWLLCEHLANVHQKAAEDNHLGSESANEALSQALCACLHL